MSRPRVIVVPMPHAQGRGLASKNKTPAPTPPPPGQGGMTGAYARLTDGERAYLADWEQRVRNLTESYGSRALAVEAMCEAGRSRAANAKVAAS